jgi:Tfp pilus assembly protein PilF
MNRFILISALLAWSLTACATSGPPLATTIGADPGAARHNEEGMTQYGLGHWQAAREHFEAAIATAPALAVLQYNLALTLDRLGAPAQATTHFKTAAELEPGNATFTQTAAARGHHDQPSSKGRDFEREFGVGGTAVPYPLNHR